MKLRKIADPKIIRNYPTFEEKIDSLRASKEHFQDPYETGL
jgi:hypothetical protein